MGKVWTMFFCITDKLYSTKITKARLCDLKKNRAEMITYDPYYGGP